MKILIASFCLFLTIPTWGADEPTPLQRFEELQRAFEKKKAEKPESLVLKTLDLLNIRGQQLELVERNPTVFWQAHERAMGHAFMFYSVGLGTGGLLWLGGSMLQDPTQAGLLQGTGIVINSLTLPTGKRLTIPAKLYSSHGLIEDIAQLLSDPRTKNTPDVYQAELDLLREHAGLEQRLNHPLRFQAKSCALHYGALAYPFRTFSRFLGVAAGASGLSYLYSRLPKEPPKPPQTTHNNSAASPPIKLTQEHSSTPTRR